MFHYGVFLCGKKFIYQLHYLVTALSIGRDTATRTFNGYVVIH